MFGAVPPSTPSHGPRWLLAVIAVATGALLLPALASATVTCSAGGVGTVVECNNEANLADIRTALGWLVGLVAFLVVVPILARTVRT